MKVVSFKIRSASDPNGHSFDERAPRMKKVIDRIDPEAFTIISDARQVRGKGFREKTMSEYRAYGNAQFQADSLFNNQKRRRSACIPCRQSGNHGERQLG